MNQFKVVNKSRRGFALLLVLGALILISVIIIGFLTTVRQDRVASAFYENGSGARQYADTAVAVATAQIAEATSNPNLAWISQPGMLRTFNAGGQVAAYKLYSSDVMMVPSGAGAYDPGDPNSVDKEVPPAGANGGAWYERPNEFVDLNSPVKIPLGTSTQNVYPIADPAATTQVEGFSLGSGINARIAKNSGGSPDPDANPLPMPVRWIYVKKDGTLVSYAKAKDDSDVVARVAFWGDDETSKVNLNTASDGVYYDTPSAASTEDFGYSLYQPVSQEYQRFPEHPATTSLAAVFPALRNISNPVTRSKTAADLFPRIGWGGSEGGTKYAWWTGALNIVNLDTDHLFASEDEPFYQRDAIGSNGKWVNSAGKRTANADYDTSKIKFFVTTNSKAPELNLLNRPRITLWPFNKELVSGPAADSASSNVLTPEDRLIRLCSEIGSNKRKLYFQREQAWNPTNDYTNIQDNQDIYAYLQDMTSKIMPSGDPNHARATRSLETKYSKLGRDQILTEMFDYIRSLVNTSNQSYAPVGGPTYSFPQNHTTSEYGSRDHCPLIINAGNGATKGIVGPMMDELVLQFYTISEAPDPSDTTYFIRKIQMVVLMNCGVAVNQLSGLVPRIQIEMKGNPWSIYQSGLPLGATPVFFRTNNGPWGSNTTPISLNFPSPGGDSTLACGYQSEYTQAYRLDGGFLGFQWPLITPKNDAAKQGDTDQAKNFAKGKAFSRGGGGAASYPFFSDVIDIRIKASTTDPTKIGQEPILQFQPGADLGATPNITVTFYAGLNKTAANLSDTQALGSGIQILKMDIPITACTFPCPKVGSSTVTTDVLGTQITQQGFGDYSKRLLQPDRNWALGVNRNFFPGNGADPVGAGQVDTFRSFRLRSDSGTFGDYRIAAVKDDISGNTYWEPHPANSKRTIFNAFSFYVPSTNRNGEAYYLTPTKLDAYANAMQIRGSVNGWTNSGSINSGRLRFTGPGMNGAKKASGGDGDFTLSYGSQSEGALVLGPDTGTAAHPGSTHPNDLPYYQTMYSRSSGSNDSSGASAGYYTNFMGLMYSPIRQIPSPVVFGTLPSRSTETPPGPWETLLFCPDPAGGKNAHRGWAETPRDHYWLDLFYMPVVEPYAITENFATAGKINLNSEIAPFSYIKRQTGLYALMRNLKVYYGAPASKSAVMKPIDVITEDQTGFTKGFLDYFSFNTKDSGTSPYHVAVDISQTLTQWDNRFSVNDPFVSPSEICEMFMIPQGETLGSVENHYQTSEGMAGDDKREMPYNHLYPRVTTRSNTFKIHFIAQTLKGKKGIWQVAGQYRGSQIVERYLDVANKTYGAATGGPAAEFPALAGNNPFDNLPYYRFRKLNNQQFAP